MPRSPTNHGAVRGGRRVRRRPHRGHSVRAASGRLHLHPCRGGGVGRAPRRGRGRRARGGISAIGADPDAASRYAATKGIGEALLREAFPTATILRPSLVFGPEDALFNRFAGLARLSPVMPVICAVVLEKSWLTVGDVADAVMAALARPDAAGAVDQLGGPCVGQFRELLAYILRKQPGRNRRLMDVPMGLARLQARIMELVPGKPLTRDQLLMLQQDNVAAADMPGLHELGIVPTPVELAVLFYRWLFWLGGGTRRVLPAEPTGGPTDLSFHTKD